ncbi:MAG: hypothetical protein ACOY3D_07625, partial [Candidatus Omnitrophota bacterium]
MLKAKREFEAANSQVNMSQPSTLEAVVLKIADMLDLANGGMPKVVAFRQTDRQFFIDGKPEPLTASVDSALWSVKMAQKEIVILTQTLIDLGADEKITQEILKVADFICEMTTRFAQGPEMNVVTNYQRLVEAYKESKLIFSTRQITALLTASGPQLASSPLQLKKAVFFLTLLAVSVIFVLNCGKKSPTAPVLPKGEYDFVTQPLALKQAAEKGAAWIVKNQLSWRSGQVSGYEVISFADFNGVRPLLPHPRWTFDQGTTMVVFSQMPNYLSIAQSIADLQVYQQNSDSLWNDGTGPGFTWDFAHTKVGNVVTLGRGLVEVSLKTAKAEYLQSAQKAARSLINRFWRNLGQDKGYFSGGYEAYQDPITGGGRIREVSWTSTEHNARAGIFFYRLWKVTNEENYKETALKIARWIKSEMWAGGHFWVGYDYGTNINTSYIEDADAQTTPIIFFNMIKEDFGAEFDPNNFNTLPWLDQTYLKNISFLGQDGKERKVSLYGKVRGQEHVWLEVSANVAAACEAWGNTDRRRQILTDIAKLQYNNGGFAYVLHKDGGAEYYPVHMPHPSVASTIAVIAAEELGALWFPKAVADDDGASSPSTRQDENTKGSLGTSSRTLSKSEGVRASSPLTIETIARRLFEARITEMDLYWANNYVKTRKSGGKPGQTQTEASMKVEVVLKPLGEDLFKLKDRERRQLEYALKKLYAAPASSPLRNGAPGTSQIFETVFHRPIIQAAKQNESILQMLNAVTVAWARLNDENAKIMAADEHLAASHIAGLAYDLRRKLGSGFSDRWQQIETALEQLRDRELKAGKVSAEDLAELTRLAYLISHPDKQHKIAAAIKDAVAGELEKGLAEMDIHMVGSLYGLAVELAERGEAGLLADIEALVNTFISGFLSVTDFEGYDFRNGGAAERFGALCNLCMNDGLISILQKQVQLVTSGRKVQFSKDNIDHQVLGLIVNYYRSRKTSADKRNFIEGFFRRLDEAIAQADTIAKLELLIILLRFGVIIHSDVFNTKLLKKLEQKDILTVIVIAKYYSDELPSLEPAFPYFEVNAGRIIESAKEALRAHSADKFASSPADKKISTAVKTVLLEDLTEKPTAGSLVYRLNCRNIIRTMESQLVISSPIIQVENLVILPSRAAILLSILPSRAAILLSILPSRAAILLSSWASSLSNLSSILLNLLSTPLNLSFSSSKILWCSSILPSTIPNLSIINSFSMPLPPLLERSINGKPLFVNANLGPASSPASAEGRVEVMARLSAEASTSEGRRAASPAEKSKPVELIIYLLGGLGCLIPTILPSVAGGKWVFVAAAEAALVFLVVAISATVGLLSIATFIKFLKRLNHSDALISAAGA